LKAHLIRGLSARDDGGRWWRAIESIPERMLWIGRILSALPILMMAMSAGMKLARAAPVLATWQEKFGYPDSTLLPIALVEACCAILYAIPRTAVLGAVLITGYLGGAIATHVRVGDPFAVPLVLGVVAWAGLFLRDARIRALLPRGQK
jgi:hypothetical protein